MKGYEDLYEPAARGIIKTRYGWMNVLEPTAEMVDIKDIAHSLSQLCRFGGHTESMYSVCQHSNVCCELMDDKEHKLAALLHDASEAYLIDVPRPVKIKLSEYKEFEDRIMKVIAEKYGFEWPLHPKVKEMDECVLRLEWDSFMRWRKADEGFYTPLYAQPPWQARHTFLTHFDVLTNR